MILSYNVRGLGNRKKWKAIREMMVEDDENRVRVRVEGGAKGLRLTNCVKRHTTVAEKERE